MLFTTGAGVGWTLPLYELALLAAARHPGASIAVVTPEQRPAAVFGPAASREVAHRLTEAGIELQAGHVPEAFEDGRLWLAEGGSLPADLVVALPQPAGPAIAGLPCDAHGLPARRPLRARARRGRRVGGRRRDRASAQAGRPRRPAGRGRGALDRRRARRARRAGRSTNRPCAACCSPATRRASCATRRSRPCPAPPASGRCGRRPERSPTRASRATWPPTSPSASRPPAESQPSPEEHHHQRPPRPEFPLLAIFAVLISSRSSHLLVIAVPSVITLIAALATVIVFAIAVCWMLGLSSGLRPDRHCPSSSPTRPGSPTVRSPPTGRSPASRSRSPCLTRRRSRSR